MAWLSLEEGDNDPASFWTYVIAALRQVVPGVGADALALLTTAQPPIQTVLPPLLNELAAVPDDIDAGARRLPPGRRTGHPGRRWRSCSSTCPRSCIW